MMKIIDRDVSKGIFENGQVKPVSRWRRISSMICGILGFVSLGLGCFLMESFSGLMMLVLTSVFFLCSIILNGGLRSHDGQAHLHEYPIFFSKVSGDDAESSENSELKK